MATVKVDPFDPRVQHLRSSPNKPSKYKFIEPTTREDIRKHRPDYAEHFPKSRILQSLDQGDCVKLCFINREDVWVWVERVDDEAYVAYGKLATMTKHLRPPMQQNQRISFSLDCICEVREQSDED